MKKPEQKRIAWQVSSSFESFTPDWKQAESKDNMLTAVLRSKVVAPKCLCYIATVVSKSAGTAFFGVSCSVGWTSNMQHDGTDHVSIITISGTLDQVLDAESVPEWKMKRFVTGVERLKRRNGLFAPLEIRDSSQLPGITATLSNDVKNYGMVFLDAMCKARFGTSLKTA